MVLQSQTNNDSSQNSNNDERACSCNRSEEPADLAFPCIYIAIATQQAFARW